MEGHLQIVVAKLHSTVSSIPEQFYFCEPKPCSKSGSINLKRVTDIWSAWIWEEHNLAGVQGERQDARREAEDVLEELLQDEDDGLQNPTASYSSEGTDDDSEPECRMPRSKYSFLVKFTAKLCHSSKQLQEVSIT